MHNSSMPQAAPSGPLSPHRTCACHMLLLVVVLHFLVTLQPTLLHDRSPAQQQQPILFPKPKGTAHVYRPVDVHLFVTP